MEQQKSMRSVIDQLRKKQQEREELESLDDENADIEFRKSASNGENSESLQSSNEAEEQEPERLQIHENILDDSLSEVQEEQIDSRVQKDNAWVQEPLAP